MATYFRLLDAGRQFFDDNGDPLNGGKLYTYEAGTTTNKTTYQDDAGEAAHANPIILDSAGRAPAEVWGTTGAYKLRLDNSLDSTIWTRDDITGVNDTAETAASEWVASGLTPTYVGATSFTFAGDQTTVYHPGRRLKTTDSGGTDYMTITASSYSAPNTTITVRVDASGSLDSGLSSVSYGLVSAANTSIPGGEFYINSGVVATAATLDITGLTTAYRAYRLVFDGLLPATDNQQLWLRLSDDAGVSYEADASDYAWALNSLSEAGANSPAGDADDSEIVLCTACGNQAGEALSGEILILNPAGAGLTQVISRICGQSATPAFAVQTAGGQIQAAGATTAFRILFESGNIAAMNWTLYGLRA